MTGGNYMAFERHDRRELAPPEPEDPENAWRDYDANENGCINPDEYMEAAQDYADGKIGYNTVLSVVRNRCE